MPSYGVTPEGFLRPTLQEIRADWEQRYRDLFGQDINLGEESIFAQMIGTEAEREDRLWQALEATYFSGYPNSASGRSLDGAVQLTGIQRLGATRSFANVVLIGVPNTTIPSGSQSSVVGTGEIFETLISYGLAATSVIQAVINVTNVLNSTNYTITINGTPYTDTSPFASTEQNILEMLEAMLPGFLDTEIDGSDLIIITSDRVTPFSISVGANLSIAQLGIPAVMRSLNFGQILAPAGLLTEIETPVAGWDEVTNYVDALSGRDIESDSALRIRRAQSLQILGTATVEAIRARLLAQVDDVTAVTVIENRLDVPDIDGRPPHSFEAIVSGGTDEDVANKIWEVKAAGIQTTGDIGVVITDSAGFSHEIRFSRPVDRYVWIKVSINRNGIGTFPTNGEDQIAANIVAYGRTLSVGDDILYQALFGPIYQVPGIQAAEVEIAITPSPDTEPPDYEFVSENVVIGSNEITIWDVARIDVEILT